MDGGAGAHSLGVRGRQPPAVWPPTSLGAPHPPLRGREHQISTLTSCIAELWQGRSAVVLMEGPPGIGKTRLIDEAAALAARSGAQVVSGKAYEDQQALPFAPLLDALIGADPPICDVSVMRRLHTAADVRFWVIEELRATVAAAAERTPLVITIDDAHWADAGTTLALQSFIEGLMHCPVLWITAMRSAGGRPEVRDALGTLVAARGTSAHRFVLNALDAASVADMTNDALGAHPDPSLLRLTDMAHGNPLLVLELLRGLTEERRIHLDNGRARANGQTLPLRLATTMERRLDRLAPSTRHTVQVASILPESFSATLLARALGQSAVHIVSAIDEAVRADLLADHDGSLRFRHDLLRHATRHTIPLALRRSIERETVEILLDLGAAPAEVAVLLARSADIGDLSAVDSLRKAAQSVARSDPSGAADLSLRALELLRPADTVRATVITETVVLLNQALRLEEALKLATSSLSSELPADQEAIIRLTQSIVPSDYPGRRAEENKRALLLPDLSPAMRAQHLAWLAHNLAGDGQTQAARDAADAALDAARSAEDPHALTIAECALARVNTVHGRGRESIDRLKAVQPQPTSPYYGLLGAIVAFDLASLHATMGALADAYDVLAEALEHSRPVVAAEQVLELVRAHCEVAAGDLSVARSIVETVLPQQDRLTMSLFGGAGLIALASVAAHTDDRSLLRDVAIAARAALDGGPAARAHALCMLAHAAWQRGDDEEAARWLGEDFALLCSPMWPVTLDYVVLAARVAATSGDASLRLRVLAALELLGVEGPTDTPLYLGVVLHARGLLENSVELLTEAANQLESSARPLLHAGAVEDVGHAAARVDDHTLAVDRLTAAFNVYIARGCSADATRVARALQRLGVHRRVVRSRTRTGWDSLTPSELRVLELVADGATNRQAAETLGVSHHTVNTHLRNLFEKLGIHTRAQLSALARGQ